MMLSLVILYLAVFSPIHEIYCTKLDVNELLDIIDLQQKVKRDSESTSDSDVSGYSYDDDKTLRARSLVQYFQPSLNNNKNKKLSQNEKLSDLYSYLAKLNDGKKERYAKNKKGVKSYVDKKNSRQMNQLVQLLLSQVGLKQRKGQDEEPVEAKNREEDAGNGRLSDLSRIYVILNPEAMETEQTPKLLSELISGLSSKPRSGLPKNLLGPKEIRYKGFPVKSSLVQQRRRRGESMEYGKDSMEGPKRPRYSNYGGGGSGGGGRGWDGGRGGGGGGAGGRTAIPYIRHRGVMYEPNR